MEKKEMIGDGEVRILIDTFENSINKKRLHRQGYRLYLWNQWVAFWKPYKYVCRNSDGTLEYGDDSHLIGTREEFEGYLDNI